MDGVLAQLVERLVRNEKVRSSSLLGSTILSLNAVTAKAAAPKRSVGGRASEHISAPNPKDPASYLTVHSSKFIFVMPSRHLEAVIFSAKSAIAALVAALGYKFFQLPGAPWVAAVSAVLVTQPDLHSSFKASLLRVAANLAGAFGGAALLVIIGEPLAAMAIGVMVTGLICYLLKLDDALRPAFVAVIIVTLIGENAKWHSSLDRVVAVVIGCVCALAVGLFFDKISGLARSRDKDGTHKTGQQE